jgi:hypothetical protein
MNTICADEDISRIGLAIYSDCFNTSLLELDLGDALARQDFGFVLDVVVQYLQNHLAIKKYGGVTVSNAK